MLVAVQYSIMACVSNALYLAKNKIDNAIIRCDGWFLVLMAVLLVLAFTIVGALAIWCTVYKGKKFTGNWKWYKWGVEISTECK